MSLSTVIDVALGMMLIYFLLSLLCSNAFEWIVARKGLRGKFLKDALSRRLGPRFTNAFYEQPTVKALCSPGSGVGSIGSIGTFGQGIGFLSDATENSSGDLTKLPSDISAQTFSQVVAPLFDGLRLAKPDPAKSDSFTVAAWGNAVLAKLATNSNTQADFQSAVESWYTQAMARVTGSYKRVASGWLFVLGLAAAIAFNADSINMFHTFWMNPKQAAAVAVVAQKDASSLNAGATATPTQGSGVDAPGGTGVKANQHEDTRTDDEKRLDGIQKEAGYLLKDQDLPIGWKHLPEGFLNWLLAGLGWFLTALAISLGAPFWFDLLGRVANLRQSGPSSTVAGATK